MQQVTVLGATGSIGDSTLDVIAKHPDVYSIYALTAHSNLEKLYQCCMRFKPVFAVVANETDQQQLQKQLVDAKLETVVLFGVDALCQVASDSDVDIVMAAIVGAAGLPATLDAVKAGKKVLLANKESLVMAGHLFMEEVEKNAATLLPVDSEHNAIFQCLPAGYRCGRNVSGGVEKILLTGSGGPFRTLPLQALETVTPDQACAHPNWSMGRKISVDSATMMNKGLELIEACWLFDCQPKDIDIVVHPQSIVHSMVQYSDGSTLAQMGQPDMRTPIAHCLAWPERIDAGVKRLDFFDVASMTFEAPDEERFPCIRLAKQAFNAGKTASAVLNAANEVAVDAFLSGQISFTAIANINERVLDSVSLQEVSDLQTVIDADQQARLLAKGMI